MGKLTYPATAAFDIWNGKFDRRGFSQGGKVHYGRVSRDGNLLAGAALCGRSGRVGAVYNLESFAKMHVSFKCSRCEKLHSQDQQEVGK